MNDVITKLKTVIGAAPTWITLATVILTSALQVAETEGFNSAAAWIATGLVWLAGATSIVRRVSPVAKPDRGL